MEPCLKRYGPPHSARSRKASNSRTPIGGKLWLITYVVKDAAYSVRYTFRNGSEISSLPHLSLILRAAGKVVRRPSFLRQPQAPAQRSSPWPRRRSLNG